jgi:tetratricopeptide (TPR) repeat protein
MNGGKHSAVVILLLASACSAAGGKLAIKAIPQPVSAAATPVAKRLAEARGLLALGSVGLALESFRLAQRDDPSSTDALAGIAGCYDRMGRFDLSRRYYEQALALAPNDPVLLGTFAASLDAQGKRADAQAVRGEIAALKQPKPQAGSITVALPAPRPAAPQAIVASDAAQPAPVAALIDTTPLTGPRLERLSLGEVALITTPQPRWKPVLVARTQASTTVRFVPLQPEPAIVPLRLLNAAREQGLAARTRAMLARRGWRDVAIGDAERTRERSLVLFSEETATHARMLAQQFGFGIAKDARPGALTILLGRDAGARLTQRS